MEPLSVQEKFTKLYRNDEDICVISMDGVSLNISRSVLTMFSPYLATLLTSIPCCSTRPTLVLPNSSSVAIISLSDLLKYGKSNHMSTDLIGLKKDVLETAKMLGITVATLEHSEEADVENNECDSEREASEQNVMETTDTELEQIPMTESITIEIVKTEVKVEKLTVELGKGTTVEVEEPEMIPGETDTIPEKEVESMTDGKEQGNINVEKLHGEQKEQEDESVTDGKEQDNINVEKLHEEQKEQENSDGNTEAETHNVSKEDEIDVEDQITEKADIGGVFETMQSEPTTDMSVEIGLDLSAEIEDEENEEIKTNQPEIILDLTVEMGLDVSKDEDDDIDEKNASGSSIEAIEDIPKEEVKSEKLVSPPKTGFSWFFKTK